MKWVLIAAAVIAAPMLIIVVGGLFLPVGHVASRRATFRRPRADVWAALTDFGAYPSWREGVKSVELLGDGRFKETNDFGAMAMEVAERREPERLVTRIAEKGSFGGTWTYELADAAGGGTTLTITERGEVYNPAFRFLSRFVFGQTKTMEQYLRSLGKKFGESVTPEGT